MQILFCEWQELVKVFYKIIVDEERLETWAHLDQLISKDVLDPVRGEIETYQMVKVDLEVIEAGHFGLLLLAEVERAGLLVHAATVLVHVHDVEESVEGGLVEVDAQVDFLAGGSVVE